MVLTIARSAAFLLFPSVLHHKSVKIDCPMPVKGRQPIFFSAATDGKSILSTRCLDWNRPEHITFH